MTPRLALPSRLDATAAGPLAADLLSRTGGPLTLDAGAVTHLGTPGLQVLLAAARSWREAGQPLTLEAPSPVVTEALALAGLSASDLTAQEE